MSGIGVFIDGANLSINWKAISNAHLDFAALRAYIEEHCQERIAEAYCFDATENGCTNGYFTAMEHCGIRVKLYEYAYEDVYASGKVVARRKIQKGVDVGLVTHMLDSRRRQGWDHLVLAAADADFAEPVQRLVELDDVKLTLLGIPEKVSHKLRPYATTVIDLRQIQSRLERPGMLLRQTA